MSCSALRMNFPSGFTDVNMCLLLQWFSTKLSFCITFCLYFLDENLRGLQHQLENRDLKHICNILNTSQSAYISNFYQLEDEIKVWKSLFQNRLLVLHFYNSNLFLIFDRKPYVRLNLMLNTYSFSWNHAISWKQLSQSQRFQNESLISLVFSESYGITLHITILCKIDTFVPQICHFT